MKVNRKIKNIVIIIKSDMYVFEIECFEKKNEILRNKLMLRNPIHYRGIFYSDLTENEREIQRKIKNSKYTEVKE